MIYSRPTWIGMSAVLLVLIPSLVIAQVPDEIAIRKLLTEQTKAWNQHDAQSWVRDFSQDSDFINIIGTHFAGQNATRERHAALFSGIFKKTHLEVEIWKVRLIGSQAAIVETVQTLRGYDALPPGIEPTEPGVLRTRMKYVLQKQAGRWKIISAQNTAIHPTP
ncbi:SgcJ/EcaC family oxidoreductase [Nostoc sp. 106C]|jgi:uncharacterized protein (TIGR02246 family)|uniref:SgcJ/EcaC family oxidoreductase n=1 Tax=Nostoc sp. 106C TaxID=1932667 RepID=UPI000A3AA52B|nr:SgcJ/EcaC family oxidoreductase [Nostoc sp. 106C]OUL21038.1 hypothetical protein BV378_27660 [Nostoc sp. RF31YmG]OUL30526.1 hypothetical protein BV375_13710 [Nostoc sp. 106C]